MLLRNSTKALTAMYGCIAVLCVIFFAGCSTSSKRFYQPSPPDSSARTLPVRIAVVEFDSNSTDIGWTKDPAYNEAQLPFVVNTTILSKSNDVRFGKCFAEDLRSARQYIAVDYYESWDMLVERFGSYEVVLMGRILKDRLEEALQTYGVAPINILPWLLGLPTHSHLREVAFDIAAFRSLHPDEHIWSQSVSFTDEGTLGFYYGRDTDAASLSDKARGYNTKNTDYCPTKFLQPQFLAARNCLFVALKEKVLAHGATPQLRSGEGGK